MTLETELAGAVERGEIHAWYQPQIDVASGQIVAVEALSRWLNPARGMVQPADFIPLAERSRVIHEIGKFMMETGCRVAADWVRKGFAIEVGINVAALQLATPPFFSHIRRLLGELSLNPRLLNIEVTETQVIKDVPAAATRLGALRDIGVGISIDDFGVGSASLAHLVGLPATELKLDQSLIQDDSARNLSLIEALVRLVQERGLRVVAEGVETQDQLERVQALGIDRAQGYLIGRAEPAERVEAIIASQGSTP